MVISGRGSAHIPFLDLGLIHADLKDAILADIEDVIETSAFTNGPQVAGFESAFAAYCGTEHAVGVASGTDALRLSLIAAGCAPGDEVIVPANTFIATLEAVTQVGAVPVLADVTETDYNLDVDAIGPLVGPRTRFVAPVHLYGQMADMRRLRPVAGSLGLTIIEDACQAHGAVRDGIRAGTVGRAAAFSFYPAKNLGAMGDAGAVVTDDGELATVVRALREHGQQAKYVHEIAGYTARLDTIQAIVLTHKLPRLAVWNAQRRAIAQAYTHALRGVGDLVLPPVPAGSDPAWHLYVVRTPNPDALAAFLRSRGIATGRHYPQPAHRSPAYASLGYRIGAFPVTEALGAQLLTLPIYPGMTLEQVDAVVDGIREYFGGS
jgi:dTDP-4-amino-4,6-dideoxygalactose transaminase